MTDVTMPQLGETVTEGTITRWFKQVGDKVAADEALFEVSTDKVDSEVPAPAAGYLAEIRVVEGDTVDVGATLAVLSDEPPGGGGGAGGAQEAEAPVDEAPVAPDESGSGEGRSEEAEQARVMSPSPSPSPPPDDGSGGAPSSDGGGGGGAGPSAAPLDEAAAPSTAASDDGGGGPDSGGPRLLSPVVRRLVAEHGLDAGAIAGTGAGGRITRNDVLAVIQAGDGRTAPRSSPAPSPARRRRPPRHGPRRRVPHPAGRATRSSPSPTCAGARPST